MIIKIQILKSLVVEAVKAATYLKGKMDEAANSNASKVSYNEIAGDDEVHERTLTRDFDTALELLKTIFVDYLVPTPQTIGDNVIYYEDKTDGIVDFTLNVSRRYNGTLTDALARLSARYVEDYMVFQWWLKTTNLKQAEPYQTMLSTDEVAIRKCFIMSGPIVPRVPYTNDLTGKVDSMPIPKNMGVEMGDSATISYFIDDGSLDDIEARSSAPRIVEIHRGLEEHTFVIVPKAEGIATITLFSRHNDSIKIKSNVTVSRKEVSDET